MSEDVLPATLPVEPPPLPTPIDAIPPAPERKPRGPVAGFLIDALLATVILMASSTVLITAVMLPALMKAGDKAASLDIDVLMQPLMPQVTVAAVLAMLVTAVGVWALRGRGQAPLPRPMSTAGAYGLAIVAGLAVQAFALAMSWGLEQFDTGIKPSNAEPLIALAKSSPWLAWLMVVLVGPFAEELLFRRVMLHRFALAGRGVAGLLLISVLFALMHEPVPGAQPLLAWLGALALYTGMGVGFGAVYLRTGRLGAAFAAHAACNLAAMGMLAYSTG